MKNDKPKNVYTLKCGYYKKQFESLRDLINDVMESGMDPNYVIYKNGKSTGEKVIDFIVF